MSCDKDDPIYPIVSSNSVTNFSDQPFINQQLTNSLYVNCKPNILKELSSGFTNTIYVNLHMFAPEHTIKTLIPNDEMISKIESNDSTFGIKSQRFQYVTKSGKI